jgi:hypothetical protein
MTEPGFVAPAAPGWWVRTNRVGITTTEYGWQISAAGARESSGSAAGAYSWTAGTAVGRRPVEFVAAAVSNNQTLTLPTHQVGELILLSAYSNTAFPSIPTAGGTVPAWVSVDSVNEFAAAARIAYFVATSTSHTSGTWTGATSVAAVVLRGFNTAAPIGGHSATNGNSTTATAPGITLTNTDGSSAIVHFYGHVNSNWPVGAPTGYTFRAEGDNTASQRINTKDATTSDGAIGQPTSGAAAQWVASSVEIRKF